MSDAMGVALNQISTIAGLCDFLESPQVQAVRFTYPVSMPAEWGSGGFAAPLWLGLGVVGVWAALDAYAERAPLPKGQCPKCGWRCGISPFTSSGKQLALQLEASLYELEDLRHLFAHNFAGRADSQYFDPKWKRHVLVAGQVVKLSSGATFDGTHISLAIPDLRYYADRSREVLQAFQ